MATPSQLDENQKKILDAQKKAIVLSVLEKCKKETSGLIIPLEDYENRTAYYTSMPVNYVYNLQQNQDDFPTETSSIDVFDRIKILECVKVYHSKHMSCKPFSVYTAIKGRFPYILKDFEHFRREMTIMGFKYKNTLNSGLIIMENPKFTFERYYYLNKIKKLRCKSSNFYYVDERIIESDLSFKKPWTISNDDKAFYEGYTFLHVISGNGYQTGLFCSPATEETFTKWMITMVLPLLTTPSVVVMDNNPLHGSITKNSITRYHSKEAMLTWLNENNIPHSPLMRKADLYKLIKKYSHMEIEHKIDRIFKLNGHEILRLPINFHDLSPTELMWRYIMTLKIITKKDTESLLLAQNKLLTALQMTPKLKWANFETTVIKKETELSIIDNDIEQLLENIEIDTSQSSFDFRKTLEDDDDYGELS